VEYVYTYAFGVLSGSIITLIATRFGANIYSNGITTITEPVEFIQEEKKVEKQPESWDWDQYNDYVNRVEEDESTKN
tara:strand:+ start:1731 stop:1961 length:231 start_codon:yes stop_codon:yes gene_type:complete